MELSFHTSRLRFLRQSAHEIRYQEETAETIVPDSYPDMASIADCCASAVLRGKDCRDGVVILSGGIKAAILYEAEDSSGVKLLELYLPFTTKFEQRDISEQTKVICDLAVRSVDARMINSRKAMIRVNLGSEIRAFEEAEEQISELRGHDPSLQIKQTEYSAELPLDSCEKSFVVTDTVQLPAGYPPVDSVYKLCCDGAVADQKLVGNKGVFKGDLLCKLVYLTQEQKPMVWHFRLPFSQYCEFAELHEEDLLHVSLMITGYDLEKDPDPRQLTVSVHMLAQCLVCGKRQFTLSEDGYCLKGEFRPEWKQHVLDCCLDRQSTELSFRHVISGQFREVLDVDVYPDLPECRREGETVRIVQPVGVRIMGVDSDGKIISFSGRGEVSQANPLSEQASAIVFRRPISDAVASVIGNGTEVRCTVSGEAVYTSRQTLLNICGGTVEPAEEQEIRPAVIVRRAAAGESLWSISKALCASVEEVRTANQLETDRIAPGALLLIPVG